MTTITATPRLALLEQARSIDDVIDNLDRIIAWSIDTGSTIGYFAVLYKRSTLAIREAIRLRLFENPERMEEFDVVFAQRYFDALNAYFHPADAGELNLAWAVSLVGHDARSTMLQQMLAGLNAHICFDLGVAAAAVPVAPMDDLKHDFDAITDVVQTQVPAMVRTFERLSPGFRWFTLITPEKYVIGNVLDRFRKGAWLFAVDLAMNPDQVRKLHVDHTSWTAALGYWYLNPPKKPWTLVPLLVWLLGHGESSDVAKNLRALDRIADHPADVRPAFRRRISPARRRP